MRSKRAALSDRLLIGLVLLAGVFGIAVMLWGTGIITAPQFGSGAVTGSVVATPAASPITGMDAAAVVNEAPIYTGPASFSTPQDTALTIDLSQYFSDPEHDELSFSAAEEDQIAAAVDGSLLTLTPAAGFAGERTLTIVASDGVNVLRAPVKIVVEGTAAPEQPPAPAPSAPQPEPQPPAPVTQNATQPPEITTSDFTNPGFTSQDVITSCPATMNTSTVLTQSITSTTTCITFGADNIALDCAGFNITFGTGGGSANGIVARNRTNVTITGCTIRDTNAAGTFGIGINFTNVNNSLIVNTSVFTNGTNDDYGIYFVSNDSNNTVTNVSVFARGTSINNIGIYFITNANNNTVDNSTISGLSTANVNNHGVRIEAASSNNLFTNNTVRTNGSSSDFGFYLFNNVTLNTIANNNITADGTSGTNIGIRLEGSGNGGVNSNFIANNTIQTFPPGASNNYGIYLFTSVSNNIVTNNTVRTNGTSTNVGIRLESTASNNTVANNNITVRGTGSNNNGVLLTTTANNNTVANNTIDMRAGTTTNDGILLQTTANNNTISNNSIMIAQMSSTDNRGIVLFSTAFNNILVNNTINTTGTINNYGIVLSTNVGNTTIANNSIQTNGSSINYGIWLTAVSDNTTIANNLITTAGADSYGIRLDNSRGNNITGNNITSAQYDGLFIEGTDITHFTNNTITSSNTINGSPIFYYGGAYDSPACPNNQLLPVNGTASHIDFLGCNNVTLTNYTSIEVLTLVNTSNMTITQIQQRSSKYGIRVFFTTGPNNISFSNITASNTTVSDNYGVYLLVAGNTTIANNNVTTISALANNHGIYLLTNATNNTVANNIVNTTGTSNNNGIRVEGNGNNNTIVNNTVSTKGSSTNNYGIVLFNTASGNLVLNNTVRANGSSSDYGIYVITAASNNTVANNSITTDGTSGTNIGIRIEGANNVPVVNNLVANNLIQTFPPGANSNYGIQLVTVVSNNIITNNTIRTNGTSITQGIRLESVVGNNTVANNNITVRASGTLNHGIYMLSTANNNTIANNTIDIRGGTTTNNGIRVEAIANNNTLNNNTITIAMMSGSDNYGIYLFNAAFNNIVINNTVNTSGTTSNIGIFLFTNVGNAIIANNSIQTNGSSINYGIYMVTQADNTTIDNNIITTAGADSYGIRMDNSRGNNITRNNITGAQYDGLFIEGTDITHFTNNTITSSNTINGSPIFYYGGAYDSPACPNNQQLLVNNTASHIDFLRCNNVTLTNYTSMEVLSLINTSNMTITQIQQRSSKYGIRVFFTTGPNTISNSNITASNTTVTDNYGIFVSVAGNTTIIGNNVTTMSALANNHGIYLVTNVTNNTVANNIVNTTGTSNNNGIRVEGNGNNNTIVNNSVNTKGSGASNYGIVLFNTASGNMVLNNTVRVNGSSSNFAVYVITQASNNTIANNNITADGPSGSNIGIRLEGAGGNVPPITNNLIANNTIAVLPQSASTNFGIYLITVVSNNVITNNTIRINGTSNDRGVQLDNTVSNNTIANNNITMRTTGSGNIAVYIVTASHNNTVANNSITMSGYANSNQGIRLESTVTNTTIANNTIFMNQSTSSDNYGIHFFNTVFNNSVTGNTIFVNATTNVYGILLQNTVGSSFFDNNNLATQGTTPGYGVFLLTTSTGSFFNRTVLNNPTDWLDADSTSAGNFTNTTFQQPNGSIAIPGRFQFNNSVLLKNKLNISANKAFLNSTAFAILNQTGIITLNGVNSSQPRPTADFDTGTFVDCPATQCTVLSFANNVLTYNTTGFTTYSWAENGLNISFTKTDNPDPVSPGTTLNYTITFMVNTGNASNVTVTDQYPAQVIFLSAQPSPLAGTNDTFIVGNLTNGTSFSVNISTQVLGNAAGLRLNNTANASFQNETGAARTVNVTEATTVLSIPTIAQVILNTTNPLTNDTNQNLTLFIINSSDPDNDITRNITDWRRNGTSIAVTNFPFETNTSSTASSAIRDYSTYRANATLGSGAQTPTWNLSGPLGGAYSFDGNDFLTSPTPTPTLPLTFEFWVKPATSTPVGIFDTAPNVAAVLRNFPGGSVEWHSGDPSVSLGLTAGAWQHLVLIFSFDTNRHITYYRNGVLNLTANGSASSGFAWSNPIRFGDINNGGAGTYTGEISEIRIYNRSLTASEVQKLYVEGNASIYPLTITGGNTIAGDNWSACATPNDNNLTGSFGDGTTVCSGTVTINAVQNASYSSPVIAQVILNTTTVALNDTNQNLTLFIINETSATNLAVQNITDWRLFNSSVYTNNGSIAFLNLPFETNQSGNVTAGAIRDYSTFGSNATLGDGSAAAAPVWNNTDRIGGAYRFDGSNDFITVPDSPLWAYGTRNFTIDLWVNFNAVNGGGFSSIPNVFIAQDDGGGATNKWIFSLGGGVLNLHINNPGQGVSVFLAQAPFSPVLNQWYHIAIRRDATNFTTFINGTAAASEVNTVAVPDASAKVTIGESEGTGFINAELDEVHIWNRSLTDAQIADIFREGNATNKHRIQTFISNETRAGDIWQSCVTPNDNITDGNTTCSNNVTVNAVQNASNVAPAIAQVILNTTNVTLNDTNQNLTLFIINETAGSNPAITNITAWSVNNRSYFLLNTPFEATISNSTFIKDYALGNNGTNYSGTTPTLNATTGPDGFGAVNFSGTTNQFYNFGSNDAFRPPAKISLEAWVNVTTFVEFAGIVSTVFDSGAVESGYGLLTHSGGSIYFVLAPEGSGIVYLTAPASSLTANRWAHVVGTYDGLTMRLYVDGVQVATQATNTKIDYNPLNNLTIGAYKDDDEFYGFNGVIAQVRVWNATLNDSQVALLNNTRLDNARVDTLVGAQLLQGQVWQSCVTPNDRSADGNATCSNNLTVATHTLNYTQVILNTTNVATNDTNQNLTLFVINASDSSASPIQNISDFRRNGTSIAFVNLPFETNTNLTQGGNIRDYSSFNNPISLGNSSVFATPFWNSTAKVGGGYRFDGANDFLETDNLDIGNNFTVELWILPQSAGAFQHLVSNAFGASNYGALYFNADHLDYYQGSSSRVTTAGGTIGQNAWTHVALVYNGSIATLYLNGTTAGTSAAFTTTFNNSVRIGQAIPFESAYFTGFMDEVKIYNRALSVEQIRQDFVLGNASLRSTVIARNETIAGDIWTACATPNDNFTDGGTFCSNNVTINPVQNVTVNNSAPSIAQVILNTTNVSSNDTNQNLTVFIINATDVDNDVVQNITDFRRNNLSIAIINFPFETNTSNITNASLRDYSTFNNNGTLGGGAAAFVPRWNNSGRPGGAYVFDGVDDYINVSDSTSLDSLQNFTLEFWLSPSPTQAASANILRKESSPFTNGFGIEMDGTPNSNTYIAGWKDGSGAQCYGTISFHLNPSAFQHLAIVKSGVLMTVYINGTSASTCTGTNANVASNDAPLQIAGWSVFISRVWNGTIDEVHIYNRSLSVEQVRIDYLRGNASQRIDVIARNETIAGDIWTACATPNDNITDGNTTCSNNVTITAQQNNPPVIAQVILNATNVSNNTNQNLTVFIINATDADNNVVQNITDWRLNRTSIAVLNMPFETNTSSLNLGAIRDYSTWSNNGTLGNGTAADAPRWNNSGQVGGAYIFDGIDDFIEVPHQSSLTFDSDFTATVWLRLNKSQASFAFSKRVGAPTFQQWDLGVVDTTDCTSSFATAGTSFCFLICNGGGTCNGAGTANGYADNRFHFVTGVRSGTTYSLYVDGAFVSSTTRAGDISNTRAFVIGNIGDLSPTAGFAFNGTIDEAIIYNRSLSAAQINQLYVDGNASRHSMTIVQNELLAGQNWSVCATPNDNISDGNTTCSNNVTITSVQNVSNRPPTIAQVILNTTNPLTNDTNQNLTVFIINATDVDNDVVQNITDFRLNNGTVFKSVNVLNMPFETNQSGNVTSGAIRDYGTYGNNGTLGNGGAAQAPVWLQRGQVGGAYQFDGSDDFIDVANSTSVDFTTTSQVSISLWINRTGGGTVQHILGKRLGCTGSGVQYQMAFDTFDGPFGLSAFAASTGENPPVGQWVHIVATYDGTNSRIYVNGTLNASATGVGINTPIATDLRIGQAGTCTPFTGIIDELQIWNRTLSQQEVSQLYADGQTHIHLSAITPPETVAGEVWQACATPNDNQTDGNTTCSNNVTINAVQNASNVAPAIAQVILNTTNVALNDTNQNLTTFIINATDADSNAVQNITDFRKNNVSIAVLNLPFENNTNNVSAGYIHDYTTFQNNATLGNGVVSQAPRWNQSSRLGGMYAFDGIDDLTTVADATSLKPLNNISIEMWLNLTGQTGVTVGGAPAGLQYILHKPRVIGSGCFEGYTILKTAAGALAIVATGSGGCGEQGSAVTTTNITTGVWYHVVSTFDGKTLRIYLNGTLEGSGAHAFDLSYTSAPLVIGQTADFFDGRFNGTISEVRIYNRNFSDAQVAQLYQEGLVNKRPMTIVQPELRAGEVWQNCVTPNDNQTNGNITCSNNVTISAQQNVTTSCPVTINVSTTLTQNITVTATAPCVTFGASNITLDCAGYTIFYDPVGAGTDAIVAENRTNVTVRNCVIIDANTGGSSGIGINFTSVNDSAVINTSIQTNGTDSNYGILITSDSNRNIIANNTIRTQGSAIDNIGIHLTTLVSGNNVTGNNITTNGTSGNIGVRMVTSASNNLVSYNSISTHGDASGNFGVAAVSSSPGNRIISNSITTNGSFNAGGISVSGTGTGNATVVNNTISTDGSSLAIGINYGIIMSGGFGSNNVSGNNISTHGVSSDFGIEIDSGTNSNVFDSNIIATAGNGSQALFIFRSNDSVFTNTVFDNPSDWMNSSANTFNNLTNTTFRMPNGSIRMNSLVQLNGSQDVTKARLNITFNRAFLNSTNLSFLNTTAVITLNGIGFSAPVPTVDFTDSGVFSTCPASVCAVVSFSGGVLVYNVTHFTSFSSTEGNVNITLTKTDSPDPVNASANLSYQITVNVTSDSPANITLTDQYPAQVIFLTAQPSPIGGTNNTFIIGNLTNGTSFAVNITVLVLNVSNGTLINNTANISYQNATSALFALNVTENTTVLNPPVVNNTNITSCPVTINTSTTLTQNLAANLTAAQSCITFGANNTALDCSGFSLNGNLTGNGINATNRLNISIRNCVIENFTMNILLQGTNMSTVANNTARNSTQQSIEIQSSSHDRVENNTAASITNTGINVTTGVNNTLMNNNGTSVSGDGIDIDTNSVNNTLINNNGTSTSQYGIQIASSFNNTLIGNRGTATGGQAIRLAQSNGNTLANSTSAGAYGISIITSDYNIILGNNATGTTAGLFLGDASSDFNNFTGNRIDAPSAAAVSIGASQNNTFVNNSFATDTATDVQLSSAIGIRGAGNLFINTTLRTNATWLSTDANSTGNNFTNTVFVSFNGSIRIIPTATLPNATSLDFRKLNVSFNRAFLNATNASFLNQSAQIALLNPTSSQPTVDFTDTNAFVICPASICTVDSFTGGTLVFNVTHFTTYSSTAGNSNLTLTKTDSPDPVNASSQLNYTITVNVTSDSPSNITLTDRYPAQVIFLSAQPSPITGTNDTFIIGNLTNGSSFSANISVFVLNLTNGTLINNTANISFQNASGVVFTASVTENTTVLSQIVQNATFNLSNISVIKTDVPDPVQNGSQLVYIINVTSNGNGTAFNVTVNDTYPSQVIFNSSQPSPVPGTNNTFILGNLTPGTSILLNITVNVSGSVTNGTVINNTVNVTFNNETSALLSRIATANTTVQNVTVNVTPIFNTSTISVTKTDAPDPVENGTQLNYTITVTSTGNGTAYNTTVTETYPSEVIFNSAQPTPSSGNNTFILGNLTPGTIVVLNITVNVSAGVINGTVINNTATVAFQNETSASLSAFATASTTVQNSTPTPTPPTPSSSGGSSGGGGGGVRRNDTSQGAQPAAGCVERWECADWSACANNKQVRTCADANTCNTAQFLPATERPCPPQAPLPEAEQPAQPGQAQPGEQPALPEVGAPLGLNVPQEQPTVSPLQTIINLFTPSLWLLIFILLAVVIATYSYMRNTHSAPSVPGYTPRTYVPPRAAIKPPAASPLKRSQKQFYGGLRDLDKALDKLDQGKLPASLKKAVQPKPEVLPAVEKVKKLPSKPAGPSVFEKMFEYEAREKQLAPVPAPKPKHVDKPARAKKSIFAKLFEQKPHSHTAKNAEMPKPVVAPRPLPSFKPATLPPIRVAEPKRRPLLGQKAFYGRLRDLDKQFEQLDRAAQKPKPRPAEKPRRIEIEPLVLPPLKQKPKKPETFYHKMDTMDKALEALEQGKLPKKTEKRIHQEEEKLRVHPEPLQLPKPEPIVVWKPKREQKEPPQAKPSAAEPLPPPPAPKPVFKPAPEKKASVVKPVVLESLADIKARALASVKAPVSERARFKGKLDRMDAALDRLDKKLKKRKI
jgi:parallel beta-helix repeat protein